MPPKRRSTGSRVKTSLLMSEAVWERAKVYGMRRRWFLARVVHEALLVFLPNEKGGES